MSRLLRPPRAAESLGASPRNVLTWQMANTCPEALERDEGDRSLEEGEEAGARPEFLEEGRGRMTPGQERQLAKSATLAMAEG